MVRGPSRLNASQALHHPWLRCRDADRGVVGKTLDQQAVEIIAGDSLSGGGEVAVVREQADVAAIVNTTREFSEYMMKAVDHELIGDIHQKLIARISVSRVFAISVPGRLKQSASELAAVMDAIERRDAEAAAQGLMVYVRNAGEAALQHLDAMSNASKADDSSQAEK